MPFTLLFRHKIPYFLKKVKNSYAKITGVEIKKAEKKCKKCDKSVDKNKHVCYNGGISLRKAKARKLKNIINQYSEV